jgi:hypothetical protein
MITTVLYVGGPPDGTREDLRDVPDKIYRTELFEPDSEGQFVADGYYRAADQVWSEQGIPDREYVNVVWVPAKLRMTVNQPDGPRL